MKPARYLLAALMGVLLAFLVALALDGCSGGSLTEPINADVTVNATHGSYAVQTNGRSFDTDAATAAIEDAYADAVRQVPKLSRVRYAFNVVVEPEPFPCKDSPTGWCHGETTYPLGPIHNGEGVEGNLYHEAGHVLCGYLFGGAECCARVGHDLPLEACAR